MIKKLSKHGNTLALVIEKPILELLGIDADTEFDVTTDGGRLMLAPIKEEDVSDGEFDTILESLTTQYEATFKRLAE